jgi:hypothetical protein
MSIISFEGAANDSTITADDPPQPARRAAHHNQRIQQSTPESGKPASGLSADPQRLGGWLYNDSH